MKKFFIALITIFAVIAALLTILLIITINKDSFNIFTRYSKANLVNTQNISLDNIDSITIEYKADDIVFYSSDTDELILKEYMSFTPTEDQLGDIKKNNSNLIIKSERKNFHFNFFGSSYYSRVEIYLPSDYSGNLAVTTSSGNIGTELYLKPGTFNASTSSGDISINEVSADIINISSTSGSIRANLIQCQSVFETSSTSGDIRLKEVSAEDIKVSSSSGSISLEKAEGNRSISATSGDIKILDGTGKSNISTSSGSITMKNCEGEFNVDSSSGDVKITAISGGGTLKTTSGRIMLDYLENVPDNVKDLTISLSSGDVTLSLPSSLHFDFSADTTSGDIRTPFDDSLNFNKRGNHASGVIGDDPQTTIQINTTSGSIRLKQY